MTIFYIHGFNSFASASDEKLVELKRIFPEHDVRPLNYDSGAVFITNVRKMIDEVAEVNDELMFIGTSLGGHYAYHLNNIFIAKAVIMNPSITPRETMIRYIGENTNFATKETYELSDYAVDSYSDLFPVERSTMVCLSRDPHIDPELTRELFGGHHKIVDIDSDEHRVSAEDIRSLEYELVNFATNYTI